MQLLKGIVAGLAVMIVLAVGFLGYGLYQKSHDPAWRLFSSPSPEAAPATGNKNFGTLNLGLPEGCAIARVRPDGNRAYLTIARSSGGTGGPSIACNRIIVIDVVTGRVLGTIQPR